MVVQDLAKVLFRGFRAQYMAQENDGQKVQKLKNLQHSWRLLC